MSALVQQRYFRFAPSSTWMLLLLSLYFSWICPAEPNVVALPGLGLVTTQQVADAAVCSFFTFSKTTDSHAIAVFPLVYPTASAPPLAQQKQREDLLPPSNVVAQLKAHRPRSAFAHS